MPLFMDIHRVDEIDPVALAGAHERDLEVQDRHGVKYIDYWYGEGSGTVFCLVEAPRAEAAEMGAPGGARVGGRRDHRVVPFDADHRLL